MIRHITEIYISDINSSSPTFRAPTVPGTGTYSQSITYDDSKGDLEKIEISVVLTKYCKEMTNDIIAWILFDNDDSDTVGTIDIPARFEIKRGNSSGCTATLKYERIPR